MNNIESADRNTEQADKDANGFSERISDSNPASGSGIKVKVSYPENVPEIIRQEKINRIYDILSGKKS